MNNIEKNPNQSNNEKEETPNLDRRKFLKNALTAGGVVASGLILGKYISESAEDYKKEHPQNNPTNSSFTENFSENDKIENLDVLSVDGIVTKIEKGEPGMTSLPGFVGQTAWMTPGEYFVYVKAGGKDIKINVEVRWGTFNMGDNVHIEYKQHTNNELEIISLKKK